ncbi:hypothetical protein [Desulfotomaculum sp. 1211_IL3151]|uniref:hypothetical protein n=1 Tax=Desulfotomaculum sp. 1211_IL3151 TaxID=3084055 RepID=UPI002FDA42E1
MNTEASDLSMTSEFANPKGSRKKKKYRMKKGLKRFLCLMLLLSLCAGGYYLLQRDMHLPLALGAETKKSEQQMQIIDTSKIYLYNPQFEKESLLIQGTILDPDLQYKNSQYKIVGNELCIRIQVQPNPEKALKEFGFKVPYDKSKIKNVYVMGASETDKCLILQSPE